MKQKSTDVVLVGAGIMSATLGALIKEVPEIIGDCVVASAFPSKA